MPKIKAICISDKKGPKNLVNFADVIDNYGIKGDFHDSSGNQPDSGNGCCRKCMDGTGGSIFKS